MEDHIAQMGQKYGPALTAAGAAMTAVGATAEVAKAATQALKEQTILSEAATKIATATQWLFNAAMDANPIMLVVLALGFIVVAVILAYNKVAWFRDLVNDAKDKMVSAFDAVKGAAETAFNWLSQNWPLVLGILSGPIGLAVTEIATHWDTIVSDITGLPGRITLGGRWHVGRHKKTAFEGALNAVIKGWNSIHPRRRASTYLACTRRA